MDEKIVLESRDISQIINDYSEKIYKDINGSEFAIVGVQTRGVELANRFIKNIENLSGEDVKSGILDITFFRDDNPSGVYAICPPQDILRVVIEPKWK